MDLTLNPVRSLIVALVKNKVRSECSIATNIRNKVVVGTTPKSGLVLTVNDIREELRILTQRGWRNLWTETGI